MLPLSTGWMLGPRLRAYRPRVLSLAEWLGAEMATLLAVMEKLNEEIRAAETGSPSGRRRMKWYVASARFPRAGW